MSITESMLERYTVDGEQVQRNSGLVHRFYHEIFVHGNVDTVKEFVAEDFVDHVPQPMPGQPTRGAEAIAWTASMLRTALPDLTMSIDDLIAAGDRVVTRVTWQGTQTGPLLGADPTGKRMSFMGIDIVRVVNGRIAEHWGQVDVLAAMAQLGFLPE
jgi:steroid delta-isomerase-like uncharacterized protein